MPVDQRPWERALAEPSRWVLAVERAYVAAALGKLADPPLALGVGRDQQELLAQAATAAVAARYLAVGTPRSLGLVCERDLAAAITAALGVWFSPSELRCAGGATEIAVGSAAAPLDRVLACDIVCVADASVTIEASALRGGTLLVLLLPFGADRLRAGDGRLEHYAASASHTLPTLAELAAGLRDGRQLDEIIVVHGDDCAVADDALAG